MVVTPDITRRTMVALIAATSTLPFASKTRSSERGLEFLALGDWGAVGGEGYYQKDVAAAMAGVPAPRFVLTLGDNFYDDGVTSTHDDLWRKRFEDVYDAPSLLCPWYPVLGDHDHRGDVAAQIAYSAGSSRWRMPAPSHKRREILPDGGTADFFFLDTTSIIASESGLKRFLPWSSADTQLAWLSAELAASDAVWKFVVGHHPVISGGPHKRDRVMSSDLRAILEKQGVAAYFCGHDHNMQHLARSDIHYFVSGAGSGLAMTSETPDTKFAHPSSPDAPMEGFMRVVVTSKRSTVQFISRQSQVMYSAMINPRPGR